MIINLFSSMLLEREITLLNGSNIPVIGLGTRMIEDPLELKLAMDSALKCGYRHFDVDCNYKIEKLIGKVIERWIRRRMVERDDLFITAKLPMAGVHPRRVEKFLDKSLKNLELKFVDLYLIEFPVCIKFDGIVDFPINELGDLETEATDIIAVWKKMEDMVELGKAKAIGLSNFNKNQISRILEHRTITPAALQIEIHPYFQNTDLVDFCREKQIPVIAYSPLGGPSMEKLSIIQNKPQRSDVKILSNDKIQRIAEKYCRSTAQIILRFLLQQEVIVIPKSSNPDRIRENIEIFDFELMQEDMKILKNLNKGYNFKIHDRKMFKGLAEHPEFPFK